MALVLWGGFIGTAVAVPLLLWNALPTCYSAMQVLRRERHLNVDFLQTRNPHWSVSYGPATGSANGTAGRSRRAIGEPLDFQRRQAWVLGGANLVRVPVRLLQRGDQVVVYPGEIVSVDGVVLRGLLCSIRKQ